MKYKIGINEVKINSIMASATQEIPKIEAVRKLASEIVEMDVKSLTGENELYEFLSLKEYPKATRQTSANLLGISSEYKNFTEALSRLKGLKRFDVNAENEVIILDSYRETIREEQTTYLEDEYVPIYKQLEKASKELMKANNMLSGGQLSHNLLWYHTSGKVGADWGAFQRLIIHKGRY